MKLKGKVAVITGGNSGIGFSIAKEFAKQGASLAILGRDGWKLEKALEKLGDRALGVQGDITNLSDLDRLFEKAEKTFGKIDVVVANAGIAQFTPIDITDEELFDRISDVNFKGAFFTVQKSVHRLNRNASIILVSSSANQIGIPEFSVYSAAKAAVRSLARTLSAELLPRGVRVNVLSPGPIDTPIYERIGLTEEAVRSMKQDISAQNPMRRFGSPEEMAKAALFLASSDSSFLAGSELVADGGASQL